MPGPVSFTINYICSPNAVFGILEYRHLQPDNTWSPWVQNIALGTFVINTSGGLNQTLTNVQGNNAEFNLNTTYQFRILQRCSGNLGNQYSAISDDAYSESCVEFVTILSAQGYVDSSYALDVYFTNPTAPGGLIDPFASSIINYSFTVFEITGANRNDIGTVVVEYTDITPGSPDYKFTITSADLTTALLAGGTYEVELEIKFLTSSGVITVDCPPDQPLVLPPCDTYKIWNKEWWTLSYTDCNGNSVKIANTQPQPPGGSFLEPPPINYFFLVCSQTVPVGGACLSAGGGSGNIFSPPASLVNGSPQNITNPVTPGTWPVTTLLWGAVVERDPNNEGCDSTWNGKIGLTNQSVTVQVPQC